MNTPTFTQASINISDMAQTWNAGATTFTAIKMNVTDTASAAGSALMDLQLAGTTVLRLQKNGLLQFGGTTSSFPALRAADANLEVRRADNGALANLVAMGVYLGSGGILSLGSDTILARDAANALAQRNGTNPQVLRVYNTFTDGSNHERANFGWSGNVLFITSEKAGTGIGRSIVIRSENQLSFSGNNGSNEQWAILSSGTLRPNPDNTHDIGTASLRPRNLYMSSWIRMATTVVASLPAAATAGAGARMFVTDALTPTFGSAVTGGGAVTVPVYSTGSAWNVG